MRVHGSAAARWTAGFVLIGVPLAAIAVFYRNGMHPPVEQGAWLWSVMAASFILLVPTFLLANLGARISWSALPSFLAIFAFWCFSLLVLSAFANRHFDDSLPDIVTATVLERRSSYVKGWVAPRHQVRVSSWAEHGGEKWIAVPSSIFEEVKPLSKVRIVIRKGALGFQWIEAIESGN